MCIETRRALLQRTCRCPARGLSPRCGEKTLPLHVGLGPSHATRACERVSLAMQRSRGTGPRATVKNGLLHRSCGEKTPPLHRRARACPSPSFALRKNVSCSLQVLKDLKRQRLPMEIAGDRPPRYGTIKTRGLSYRTHRFMKHPLFINIPHLLPQETAWRARRTRARLYRSHRSPYRQRTLV